LRQLEAGSDWPQLPGDEMTAEPEDRLIRDDSKNFER